MRWLKHIHYGGKRCLLLGPRRHGKSVAINTVYLSWILCQNPHLRMFILSHKDARAKDFSGRLRASIDNKQMKEDYGLERGMAWQITYWQISTSNKNKLEYPTVETSGVGAGVAGGSYDWIIFDDICSENNSATEDKRNTLSNWIDDVFNTQDSGPNQKTIFLGTRKHKNDYYSTLLIDPNYSCKVDKAIQDDGTALWPENYSIEELEARKARKPRNFSFEWQQEPVDVEGNLFKREWLNRTGVIYDSKDLPPDSELKYYMGVDLSQGSQNKRSTFFSYAVAAYHPSKDRIYVVDMFRGKLTVEQQKKRIREEYWKYNNGHHLVQCRIEAPMAYAQLYKDVLDELPRAKAYSPMHDNLAGVKLPDKMVRIETILSSPFEIGKISLLNPKDNFYTNLFIENEFVQFPNGDFDMLDALVYAVADLTKKQTFSGSSFIFARS